MTPGPAEFQGALVQLSNRLAIEAKKVTGALARLDRGEAMRYMSDAYPEVASPFLAAAGDISATWYEEQPSTKRSGRLFVAKPADLPPVEQLAANGRWALTQPDPGNALVGSSRRATFNQSRDTILNNAQEEGVRWIRHARSGACGFCRMLATRVLTEGHGGAPGLYRSEGTASRNSHRPNATGHDFCRCIILPLRDGAEYVVPDYLPQWLDDYNAVSRDADGRLLPAQKIADRMEAIGRERGDHGDVIRGRKGSAGPDVVNLDTPATVRDRLAGAQRLTERNAVRADEIVQPIADRVAQAKAVADRADDIVSTAARVTGQTKKVVDVADKLLGANYPAVRSVKTLVDAADKALGTANQVTGGAAKVARVADRTLKDTTAIAHGVKQVADEVGGVLDETAAIALGVRGLVADAGKAAADVRGADGFIERATAAVDAATGIQADAAALVERARGTVDTAQSVIASVAELPDTLRKPVADMQKLAQAVRDVAADVEHAGADAGAVARKVRQLVDTLRDYRRAEATVADAAGPPIRVMSERLDVPKPAIEAPEAQLALNRPPAPLAIEAARQPKMLTAAPSAPAIPPPDPRAIAEWLDAEDAHRAAVEYWRRVDEENLHALPAEQAILEPRPAKMPAVAERPVDVPDDPAPVATVQTVDRAGESELDRSVREFEEAVASGDDARIEAAAAAMDAAEQAEQLVAERAAKRAQRADTIAEAEQERIYAAIESGTDPVEAEADVLIGRPSQTRKIRDMVKSGLYDQDSATTTVYGQVVERIRRRDFMAQARAEGHGGKGFDDLLDSVFQRRADELYIEAENACNGQMVKRQYAQKFDPKRFWYCNDNTARKYMSDELAEWFDQNGRLTRPVMRQMVLDGSTNFDAYTATRADYLQ